MAWMARYFAGRIPGINDGDLQSAVKLYARKIVRRNDSSR
jgi:hypothetical protein